jgi:uncharacterized protein (DUF885 family)
VDEVVSRFAEIAHVPEAEARRQVIRGTNDPTYLYAALGRLQILDIRRDYRDRLESEGESFDLAEFHDRMLRLALPLPLLREHLLPLPPEAAQARGSFPGRTRPTPSREG